MQIDIVDSAGIIVNSAFLLLALMYLFKTTKELKDGIVFYLFAGALITRVIASLLLCYRPECLDVVMVRNILRIISGYLTFESFRMLYVEVRNHVVKTDVLD